MDQDQFEQLINAIDRHAMVVVAAIVATGKGMGVDAATTFAQRILTTQFLAQEAGGTLPKTEELEADCEGK